MDKNIHWYELCFFGDEDTESEKYDSNKACSYGIMQDLMIRNAKKSHFVELIFQLKRSITQVLTIFKQ